MGWPMLLPGSLPSPVLGLYESALLEPFRYNNPLLVSDNNRSGRLSETL